MKRRLDMKVLAGLMAAAFSLGVDAAADTPDLPPLAAVRQSLEQDPSVLAARAELSADEASRMRLRAGNYEPTLRVGGQRRRVDETSSNFGEWDVSVDRALRLPGKAQLDSQIGDQTVERGRAAYGDALHEAGRSLLRDWFAWIKADASVRQWRAQVDVLRELHTATAKRLRAGDASRLEVDQGEAAVMQAEAQRVLAAAAAQEARQSLGLRHGGIPLPDQPRVEEPATVDGEYAFWHERILAESHELMLARNESARAQLSAKRADAERRPDPTLGMRYASERSGAERIVGLSIAVPLPGQARSANADAYSAMAQASAQREAAVLRKLESESAASYSRATSARENWLNLKLAAERVEQNASLVARAYALGENTLSDALLARRQAVEARLAATLAQLDAAEARYRLLLDAHMIWDFDQRE